MMNTVHTSIGLAVGRRIPNPVAAFFFGLVSHFAFDAVPHWDGSLAIALEEVRAGKIKKYTITMAADLVGGVFVVALGLWQGWLGWSGAYLHVWAGVLGGILPDLFWAPYYLFGLRRPRFFFEFHRRIQRRAAFFPSIIFQFLLILFCFWLAR